MRLWVYYDTISDIKLLNSNPVHSAPNFRKFCKNKREREENYLKYEDFICFIQAKMQERLGKEVQLQIQRITKNNSVVLDGLSISEKDSGIAPTIYLKEYYQQYQEGRTIPELLDAMLEAYEQNRTLLDFDTSFYADFSKVRLQLMCRIVNREKNRELLKRIPARDFLDLAIVVCYRFEDEIIGNGSILVHKNHLEGWQVTEDELFRIARENTLRIQPDEFMSMNSILKKYHIEANEEDDQTMYVLTNKSNYFGAVGIIYDSVLAGIGAELGDDFWVLPSSIHECVIVPASVEKNGAELENMVREINRREVHVEEFLSDNIYFYRRKLHKLSQKE